MTNYPGPTAWLEAAAQTIPHQPSDVNRAKNIEGFGVFSDLIGQAVAQPDPAVRAEQIGVARLHLAPLWIALAAAEAILSDIDRPATTDANADPDSPTPRKGKAR